MPCTAIRSWRQLQSVLRGAENWRIFFDQNGKDAGWKLEKTSLLMTAPIDSVCELESKPGVVISHSTDDDNSVILQQVLQNHAMHVMMWTTHIQDLVTPVFYLTVNLCLNTNTDSSICYAPDLRDDGWCLSVRPSICLSVCRVPRERKGLGNPKLAG